MKNFMTITQDTIISGGLKTKGNVRFEGRLEGGGQIYGLLLIAEPAKWKGNAVADIVVIEGSIIGEVVAREKLIVLNGARVVGNLYSPSIQIAPGAKITGSMKMKQPPPPELLANPARYRPVPPRALTNQQKTVQAARRQSVNRAASA